MACILIVDDDHRFRKYLNRTLHSAGHTVEEASSGEEAIRRIQSGQKPHMVFLDLMMPGMDGHQTLAGLLRLDPGLRVVILSGRNTPVDIVKAIKAGAMDYLTKEAKPAEIRATTERCAAWETSAAKPSPAGERAEPGCLFISAAMREIQAIADRVADIPVKILLLGASGTGKDMLARYIHSRSDRKDHPFVKVNCAALPAELVESELFGYEKGAFTGAAQSRKGKFEQAGQGSLYLDEIGELPPNTQAKLLQALEDDEYPRLGGSGYKKITARIIAATNKNLVEALEKGAFRQDLYYRLRAVTITLPPLCDRREEIGPLSLAFCQEFAQEFGIPTPLIPPDLVTALQDYRWPGNIRELKNLIREFVIFGNPEILASRLLARPAPPVTRPAPPPADVREIQATAAAGMKDCSRVARQEVEREMILNALEETHWNRKRAAEKLKVSYKAFRNKLRELSIEKARREDGI